MLKGNHVTLRPVHEDDLEKLYQYHTDIQNRGNYYPRGIVSHSGFKKRFEETGYWSKDDGTLLLVTPDNEIVGHIEFFKTVSYLDEYEIAYQIYNTEQRNKGVMTEAVRMMTRYLFETKPMNRIRLVIHPDNLASRRLAEKCGFQHEGTARGAWYNNGRHHDVEIYAILHDEVIAAG